MRISRIYIGRTMAIGDEFALDTASSHYVKNVLRLKTGAEVDLFSEHELADYRARLQISSKACLVSIQSLHAFNNESNLKVNLLLGLSRGDHLDWSIQKATELGVSSITLFNADHSQMPVKAAQQDKKLAHWKAIAIKASEQSRRHLIPAITLCRSLNSALEIRFNTELNWIAHFEGKRIQQIKMTADTCRANLLIGPEGGLSSSEVSFALENGFQAMTLGPRVLRTETAVATGLSLLQNRMGDI